MSNAPGEGTVYAQAERAEKTQLIWGTRCFHKRWMMRLAGPGRRLAMREVCFSSGSHRSHWGASDGGVMSSGQCALETSHTVVRTCLSGETGDLLPFEEG